jgi:ketosteroid isomerase-like protein
LRVVLQENVEIVRKVFDLVPRDPEAGLAFIDAEGVMDWTASRGPLSGVFRGHAEIRSMWRAFLEAWDEWTTEVQEAIEVDPETVVVVTRVRGRGKGSGVLVEAHGASVWSIRDGKVTRATLFQSKAEALEAAALSERDAHADAS